MNVDHLINGGCINREIMIELEGRNYFTQEEKQMKKVLTKVIGILIAALPVVATMAMTVSANSIATPTWGQPVPPESIKKYRKF